MTSLRSTLSPRRPRAIAFVAATALVLVGSYASVALRATPDQRSVPVPPVAAEAERPMPSADTTIDGGGTPPASTAQIDHSIAAWSKNLEANPSDFLAATNLATLYHGRGRLTGDLGDYDRALAAARTALDIVPSHGPARAVEAAVLHSMHDFTAAYAAADALLRDDPTQIGVLATRFDAALELGRIDDARGDIARLREVGGPAVLIRDARLASVTGDLAGALELARAAQAAVIADDADDVGFYAYALGEYARLAGDAPAARAAFRDAIEERGDDIGALVGLARVDAFDGRVGASVASLRRATAIAPQPESLALLGDLLAANGDPGAAEAFETVRFIGWLGDAEGRVYDRQLSQFELDHGGASEDLLARARDSLATRSDWAGHDTVAWALYRLGRYDEASASIDAARAFGADGARLRFHDGAIRVASGDVTAGRDLLRSALELGPALDPIERAEAMRILGSI